MNKFSKIRKIPGKNKWEVLSENGKSLGTYNTISEAKKRLGQIEYFKQKNDSLSEPEYFGDPPEFLEVSIKSKYSSENYNKKINKEIFMLKELKKLSNSLKLMKKYAEMNEIDNIANSIETSSTKTPFLNELKEVDTSEYKDASVSLESSLSKMIFHVKAMEIWFHGAHHVTGGIGFAGDHVNLYSKIYEDISEDYDAVAEKAIGLANENLACPIAVSSGANKIISLFESPCGKNSNEIAKIGFDIISKYLDELDEIYLELKESNLLTLGLDDFIMSMANDYEEILYLLKQRTSD